MEITSTKKHHSITDQCLGVGLLKYPALVYCTEHMVLFDPRFDNMVLKIAPNTIRHDDGRFSACVPQNLPDGMRTWCMCGWNKRVDTGECKWLTKSN